jgi:hypothetical protein
MKNIYIFLIGLFICLNTLGNERRYFVYINTGVPLIINKDWSSSNYILDFGIDKFISKNFKSGLGINSYKASLLPSMLKLSFDRRSIEFYFKSSFSIIISNNIEIIPGIRLGYSFLEYSLNEFVSTHEKAHGFSLTPELSASTLLSDRISLFLGIAFNSIFTQFYIDDSIYIPAANFKSDDLIVFQPGVKIGLALSF